MARGSDDRITLVGHLTRDLVRIGERSVSAPGGTVHYAGIAYARLGAHVRVVTKLAPEDAGELAAPLRGAGCEVEVLASRASTQFENVLSDDLSRREQSVAAVADRFEPTDFTALQSHILHLGPLTQYEMSFECLARAALCAPVIVLDVQGLVRRLEGQRVLRCAWPDARAVLPLCHVVKADLDEASAVTGERAPEPAARALLELGAREVLLTMAEQGSYVATAGAVRYVPALAPRVAVDSTGAGDTYTAGYVVARLRGDAVLEAARFASAVASLSIEQSGPFAGTLAEVEARLAHPSSARET